MSGSELDGAQLARLAPWLREHAGARGDLRSELVAGGRSNLTYRIVDEAGTAWALRTPPRGGVLAGAHDVAREHRILAGLGRAPGVPVPRTTGPVGDPDLLGVPFVVMEFVEGTVVRSAADAASIPTATRWRLATAAGDALAAVHGANVEAIGLGKLGARSGYPQRQLRRWQTQLVTAGLTDSILTEGHRRLSAAIPAETGCTVVHGDYRLDNLVAGPDGAIRAILDWELATLGDPLADLALLLVYWPERPGEPSIVADPPTVLAGFPAREHLIRRYAHAAGLEPGTLDERLPYWTAFASWKLACIIAGVVARYRAGFGGGQAPDDLDRLAAAGTSYAEQALVALPRTSVS